MYLRSLFADWMSVVIYLQLRGLLRKHFDLSIHRRLEELLLEERQSRFEKLAPIEKDFSLNQILFSPSCQKSFLKVFNLKEPKAGYWCVTTPETHCGRNRKPACSKVACSTCRISLESTLLVLQAFYKSFGCFLESMPAFGLP